MMVGEVASLGHECQELSSYLLPGADMVITEPVADILIAGQDVPVVAESPDHLNTFDPDLHPDYSFLGLRCFRSCCIYVSGLIQAFLFYLWVLSCIL